MLLMVGEFDVHVHAIKNMLATEIKAFKSIE
jgi:hypothetical protein